ncbi:MAG: DNA primase [Candidatus Krumholzibacteriia bacterium]
MALSLPREIVVRIKEETDIVDVVRRYVTLHAAGSAFKALCPFHREKGPSFHVNPARQIYKCFGCGEGGDVISFLMKVEGLSFPEAVETLARPLDIDLAKYLAEDEGEGERLAFHRANDAAARLWQEAFWSERGEAARGYLRERGFGDDAARRYEVGWAPPGGGWLVEALSREGVSQELALRAGLFGQRGTEPPFAYFRGRIIFPIRNVAQRVAGFGGRLLGQGEPKYLNSPESAYFSKGKLLYGFASSRIAIARLKTAILVEGYLDLIALAQAGFANGVATCGTAFTPDQARLLRRGCPTVFLLFDGDRAGLGAAVKGCQTALAQGLEPRVARLPQGEDPASFLQTRDAAALGGILAQASGYLPFLRALVEERGGSRVAKERAVKRALESIAQVPDPIRQAYLLQETAELFGLGLGILEREAARLRADPRQGGGRGGAEETAEAPGVVAPGAARPVAAGRPWLDRAAVEAVMFAHALRDDTGRAAGELLRLRAERACATPEGDLLRGELLRWQAARAAGEEAPPGSFVQTEWHEFSAAYRSFVAELLEGDLVPERGDFVKAVRDVHERLELDAEMERRRAGAAR